MACPRYSDDDGGDDDPETKRRRPFDAERDKKRIRARLEAFASAEAPAAMLPDDDGNEIAFISRRCVRIAPAAAPTEATRAHARTRTLARHTYSREHRCRTSAAQLCSPGTNRVGWVVTFGCAPPPPSPTPPHPTAPLVLVVRQIPRRAAAHRLVLLRRLAHLRRHVRSRGGHPDDMVLLRRRLHLHRAYVL